MIVLLRASAGLILWSIGFAILYGLHGVSCASGWHVRRIGPVSLHHAALLAAWGVAIIAGAALAWRERHGGTFADRLDRAGAIAGVVATVATGVPILIFAGCV